MIYRLCSNTTDILYSSTNPPMPAFRTGLMHGCEYEFQFEEIPTEPEWEHCRLYKAPILPDWRMNTPYTVQIRKKGMVFPGFISTGTKILVSETAKQVVEEVDPFSHQFWPVTVTDKKGNSVSDEQYFRMNMRRFISIADCGQHASHTDFGIIGEVERHAIPSIRNNSTLRQQVESLCLWQLVNWRKLPSEAFMRYELVVFMNQTMVDSLWAAGIEGLEEIKIVRNNYKGTLGHV